MVSQQPTPLAPHEIRNRIGVPGVLPPFGPSQFGHKQADRSLIRATSLGNALLADILILVGFAAVPASLLKLGCRSLKATRLAATYVIRRAVCDDQFTVWTNLTT